MNFLMVWIGRVLRAVAAVLTLLGTCFSTPLNNVYDTQPLYTYFCSDKFYKNRDQGEIRIHISPFYQNARAARDKSGAKVPGGDRLGKWNMVGVLFDALKGDVGVANYIQSLAPVSKPFTIPGAAFGLVPGAIPVVAGNNYPNMYNAFGTVVEVTSQNVVADSRYRIGGAAGTATPDASNLTQAKFFNPNQHTFAYISVPASYEKIGVRSQINFDFGFGLGVALKGGVVNVKNRAKKFVLEDKFRVDLQEPAFEVEGYASGADSEADAPFLFNNLLSPVARAAVLKDVDISLITFRKTSPEDLHMQLYWHLPVDSYDQDGSVGMTLVPYFAFGVWFPASEGATQNNAFAVPVGNNGYYGYTFDASLALDFPSVPRSDQTLQLSIGGGAALYNERELKDQRFPSSKFQQGVIPWKAKIKQQPGATWYMNVSMKSEHFVDSFSLYLDYIYTQHLRDRVTIMETDPDRLAGFTGGLDRYRNDTVWKNQQVQAGLNYDLTEAISINGAVQAQITGVQVFRTVTVMGGVNVTF